MYCKQCGKKIPKSRKLFRRKFTPKFCSNRCIWQYNNKRRDKSKIATYGKAYRKRRLIVEGDSYKKLLRKQQLECRRKLRLEIFNHYGKGNIKCSCCGEDNIKFLTLDHINGRGRTDPLKSGGGYTFYYKLRKMGFPKGFRILCYNCNCGREHNIDNPGVCPHKEQ